MRTSGCLLPQEQNTERICRMTDKYMFFNILNGTRNTISRKRIYILQK